MTKLRTYHHPDHTSTWLNTGLGSSASTRLSNLWITDNTGRPIQHLHYLPFGEDWIDQRNTSWNALYTFSGKEKDVETGYGYFGARYYDSGLSIWLSVDPMSDKYPSMSPYNYCANNPVIIIDPDGQDWIKGEDGNISYTEEITSAKQFKDSKMSGTYLGKTYTDTKTGKYCSLFGQKLDANSVIGKLTQKIDEAVISYAQYRINSQNYNESQNQWSQDDFSPVQPEVDFSTIIPFCDQFYTTTQNIHDSDPKTNVPFTYAGLSNITLIVTGKRMSGKLSGFSYTNSHLSGKNGFNQISGNLLYIANYQGNLSNKIVTLNFKSTENLKKFEAKFYKLFPEIKR